MQDPALSLQVGSDPTGQIIRTSNMEVISQVCQKFAQVCTGYLDQGEFSNAQFSHHQPSHPCTPAAVRAFNLLSSHWSLDQITAPSGVEPLVMSIRRCCVYPRGISGRSGLSALCLVSKPLSSSSPDKVSSPSSRDLRPSAGNCVETAWMSTRVGSPSCTIHGCLPEYAQP